MKQYLPLLPILILLSCSPERPLNTSRSENNKTYTVDYLFEHDGCKVYRFYDNGRYVYFTNCKGEAVSMADSTEVRNKTVLASH